MNLFIDSGNSAAKVAIFDNDKLIEKRSFSSLEELQAFVQSGTYRHVVISSVKADAQAIVEP